MVTNTRKRKLINILAALSIFAVPALAVFTGMDLDATLSNLRRELYHDYLLISETREQLGSKYEVQHQKMVDIVKKCNDLSLMLYSQKQDYTFDVSYALERVMQEYDEFNANRTPYDRIVSSLDVEINRYARLIESLRRLPPELRDVEVVPDSLAYHNDTLDAHLMANESLLQQELNAQLESLLAVAVASAEHPSVFILSEDGQTDRDSCLLYASELLKLYAETRELVMADSTHYREAQLRMAESYNYARDYSALLQDKVFKEGQTPWKSILAQPEEYWKEAWRAMAEKYNFSSFMKKLAEKEQVDRNGEIAKDNQMTNSARIYWLFVYFLAFFVLWGLSYLLLMPLYRFVKPLGNRVAKEQKLFLAILLACVLFVVLSNESSDDDIVRKSAHLHLAADGYQHGPAHPAGTGQTPIQRPDLFAHHFYGPGCDQLPGAVHAQRLPEYHPHAAAPGDGAVAAAGKPEAQREDGQDRCGDCVGFLWSYGYCPDC